MNQLSEILGTHLPRYELGDRLGAGGNATVYRARDHHLQRDVAIKVLHAHLVEEESFKERFEYEARLIAGFSHPNIVHIFDYDTLQSGDQRIYYMIMPYLAGGTLTDLLKRCKKEEELLPLSRVKKIMEGLTSALDYAHKRGLIHRDIKPANILFDEHENAILTDFGIARGGGGKHLTVEGTIIGTPVYMSPEQARSEELDHRSDIYSLGVVLYEMLAGQPPFQDSDLLAVMYKHIHEQPEPVSSFREQEDVALDLVLDNALEKNMVKRYSSAGRLMADLSACLDGELLGSKRSDFISGGTPVNNQNGTLVLETTENTTRMVSTLTRQIETIFIKPARNNPLSIVAIAIALAALVVILRLSYSLVPSEPVNEPEVSSMTSSMTDDEFYFETNFDVLNDETLGYWETNDTGPTTRKIAEGQYMISSEEPEVAVTALFDQAYMYGEIAITMEGHLLETSANPSSGYGVVYQYTDPDNYDVFAADGRGRYSIWSRDDGVWRELRNADQNWTDHPAINPIGSQNSFEVIIKEESIQASINGELIIEVEQPKSTGAVGIYLASTREGGAAASIARYGVSPAGKSTESGQPADSMTDDDKP